MSELTFNGGERVRMGRIEVICGSMFSGKTEELIRRLRRAQFARQRVEIFKPSIDVRYSEEDVVSHQGNSILSTPVDSSQSILLLGSESDVIVFLSVIIDYFNETRENSGNFNEAMDTECLVCGINREKIEKIIKNEREDEDYAFFNY